MEICFDDKIRLAAPGLRVVAISAKVRNTPTSDALWHEVEEACGEIMARYPLDCINKRPAIAATRSAYKALGKEPNRYRPSAEALCRRLVNGKGLYRLTALVDIINLISIKSGYSIGGFDADRIEGELLVLGSGNPGEEFHAIGRGLLNIAGLPVYRDSKGPIGTPTSDEERTCLTETTTHLLMLVNIYGEEMETEEIIHLSRRLLTDHASAEDFQSRIVNL